MQIQTITQPRVKPSLQHGRQACEDRLSQISWATFQERRRRALRQRNALKALLSILK